MSDQSLPDGFRELPAEEQRRIRESGRAILDLAYRHTGHIIISSTPAANSPFNSASCFLLKLEERIFLVTAEHVLEETEKLLKDDPTLKWQVGQLVIDPRERISFREVKTDRLFLLLRLTEVAQTGLPVLSAAAGWPTPTLKPGDYVAVAGFPAYMRERLSAAAIQFDCMTGIHRVTTVGAAYCVCQWEREEYITLRGSGAPPVGTKLGGMSGGPVLKIGAIAFPVVGLVSQFHTDFELLRIATFDDIPLEKLSSVMLK